MAFGLTEGDAIAAELGTVVIGGRFSATLLTLIILAVAYSLVDDGMMRARSLARVFRMPARSSNSSTRLVGN